MTDNKTAWEERRRAERINALSAIRGLASDLLRYEQSNVKVHFAVDLPPAADLGWRGGELTTPEKFFFDGPVNAVGDDCEPENAAEAENPSAFNVTLTGGVEVAVDLKVSAFEFAEMDDSERSLVLGLLDLCRNFKQGGN